MRSQQVYPAHQNRDLPLAPNFARENDFQKTAFFKPDPRTN